MLLITNFKIFVIIVALICYIITYGFIRNAACCGREESNRPKVFAPVLLTNFWELLLYFPAANPFHLLNYFTHGNVRRNAQKQMNVVVPNISFQYLNSKTFTLSPDYISNSLGDLFIQHFLSILRAKHYVELVVVKCMARAIYVFHPAKILKFCAGSAEFFSLTKVINKNILAYLHFIN